MKMKILDLIKVKETEAATCKILNDIFSKYIFFYFRFNPDKIKVTEFAHKSQFRHRETKIMNYKDGILAVGTSAWSSTYGRKAELFDFRTNEWIEKDDYPGHDISNYAAVSIDKFLTP